MRLKKEREVNTGPNRKKKEKNVSSVSVLRPYKHSVFINIFKIHMGLYTDGGEVYHKGPNQQAAQSYMRKG